MKRCIQTGFAAFGFLVVAAAQAAIKTEVVDYNDGDVALQGHLVWDDALEGKRPGVIVVHEWWGLNDYVRKRAEMLAKLGYVAFAIDMYGKGKVTEHGDQAREWMSQITANAEQWQARALLALDILKQNELVASEKTAAIGYCFGGATVMQMAYAGSDLSGVASFHGALPVATDEQAQAIKAAVYVAHGEEDAFVPPERVEQFRAALTRAGVDFNFVAFPGARHGFTVPEADKRGMENLRYDEKADQTSWKQLQDFLKRVFQ